MRQILRQGPWAGRGAIVGMPVTKTSSILNSALSAQSRAASFFRIPGGHSTALLARVQVELVKDPPGLGRLGQNLLKSIEETSTECFEIHDYHVDLMQSWGLHTSER